METREKSGDAQNSASAAARWTHRSGRSRSLTPVDEQPANVVHVDVGKHHVGHGCEIDVGGLQSQGQPPGPREVRVLHP